MNAAINDKDIYSGSGNPLKPVQDDIQQSIDLINKLKTEAEKSLQEIGKEFYKLSNQTNINSEAIKQQAILEKRAEEASINLAKAKKLEADINLVNQKRINLEAQEQRKANNEKERASKVASNASSVYKNLSQQHSTLRQQAKDLAVEFGVESKQFKEAAAKANELDVNLKKIDSALGQNTRNVGNYSSAWSGVKSSLTSVAGALGITAGISGLAMAVNKVIDTFSGYSAKVSEVKALSGATGTEMKALTNDAKRLGATTQKSAKDVAQLQIEFAKLGFKPDAIINATEATLKLSIATGEDLASSAAVAGATLNGFGLQTTETNRVVDVMAQAFTNSALDLEKFKESMKTIAPIAKAANISLETTTAILGKLADAGIDGSIAGTGLKNLLSDLTDENSALSKRLGYTVKSSDDLKKAFRDLSKQGIDLGEATQIVDERTKAAFLSVISSVPAIEKLEDKLNNASGAAKRMADIMADNLQGDTFALQSAMEGLSISIGERLEPSLRATKQWFTGIVSSINDWIKISPVEELERESVSLNTMLRDLSDVNLGYDDKIKLMTKINEINPDLLKGLEAENLNYEELNKRIQEYNDLFIKRLIFQKQIQEQQEIQKDFDEISIKLANTRQEILRRSSEEELVLRQKNTKAADEFSKIWRDGNKSLQERYDLSEKIARQFNVLSPATFYLLQEEQKYNEQLTEAKEKLNKVNRETLKIQGDLNLLPTIELPDLNIDELNNSLDETSAYLNKIALQDVQELGKSFKKEMKDNENDLKKLNDQLIKLSENLSKIKEELNKEFNADINLNAKEFEKGFDDLQEKEREGIEKQSEYKKKFISEKDQELLEMRKSLNLASDEELQQQEIDNLNKFYFEKSLPVDKKYFEAVSAIQQKYENKKLKKTAETLDTIGQFVSLAGDFYEAQKQRELKAAGDNEAEKERIEKKYAEKQKDIAIAGLFINTASAIMKNIAELGFLPAIPINLLTLAASALQLSTIEAQGFATGVIGLQGEGTEKSDSIPAWLSKGESVITARGTNNAPETLTAINEGLLDDARIMRAIEIANVLEQGKQIGSTNIIDLSLLIEGLSAIDDKLGRTKFILPDGKYTIIDIYGNKIKNIP